MLLTLICDTYGPGNALPYAVLRITDKDAVNLLQLRKVFQSVSKRALTLYCLEIFDYRISYYAYSGTESFPESMWQTVPADTSFVEEQQTAAPTMKVTKDGILWVAQPK